MARWIPGVVASVALMVIVSTPVLAAERTMEGKIVKAGQEKIVMTDNQGKDQHEHSVSKDTKIMLDGKKAELKDLKAGYFVRVTYKDDDPKKTATKIEARTRAGS